MYKTFTRILFAVALCFSHWAQAQNDPYYTHYMLNRLAFNPAAAGEKNAICANALTHQQWLGQAADDPAFRTLRGELPGASAPGVNPSTNTFSITAPFLKKNQLGIGLQAIQDKLGYQSTLQLRLSASYKFGFGRKLLNGENDQIIAVGIDGGMFQGSLDGTQYNPLEPNDPIIPLTKVNGNSTDFGFGLLYTHQTLNNLYVGLSATHITGGSVRYDWQGGGLDYKLDPHWYLLAGTTHKLNPSISLLPSILVKQIGSKTQIDMTGRVELNNKFLGGLAFRTGDALSLIAGYYIKPNFYAGYSYDTNVASGIMRYTSAGTHEVFISYCFDLNPPIPPPVRPRYNTRYLQGYSY